MSHVFLFAKYVSSRLLELEKEKKELEIILETLVIDADTLAIKECLECLIKKWRHL